MTREQKLKKIGNFYMLNAEIIIDQRLTDFDKILYSLVNGLSNGIDGCTMSDNSMAQILNKSKSSISRSLKKLEDLNYLKRFTENIGEKRGSTRQIYTRETLKNKECLIRKNEHQSKKRSSSMQKTVRTSDDSNIIDKLINNNSDSEFEKIKNRIFLLARENNYKIGKVSLEVSNIKTLSDLKNYEKRIINKELRF